MSRSSNQEDHCGDSLQRIIFIAEGQALVEPARYRKTYLRATNSSRRGGYLNPDRSRYVLCLVFASKRQSTPAHPKVANNPKPSHHHDKIKKKKSDRQLPRFSKTTPFRSPFYPNGRKSKATQTNIKNVFSFRKKCFPMSFSTSRVLAKNNDIRKQIPSPHFENSSLENKNRPKKLQATSGEVVNMVNRPSQNRKILMAWASSRSLKSASCDPRNRRVRESPRG